MLVWTKVLVLLALVEGYKENLCQKRDPPPGVLVLTPGSHVLLHCHGDVIVDSVLKVKGQTERPFLRVEQQNEGTTSDGTHHTPRAESPTVAYHTDAETKTESAFSEAHHETTDGFSHGKHQKDTKVIPTDGHDNNRIPTPSTDQRETGRTSTSTSTSSDDVTEEGGAVNLERRSYWTLNGVPVQGSRGESVLMLPHLSLKDLGNYTCYRQGVMLSSVKIIFGTPPERPSLSCYRRSPDSKIRCDWTSPRPVEPPLRCSLLIQKSSRQVSEVMCKYSVAHSRCWCVLDHEEHGGWGSRSVYTARLCVTNTAGNATSPSIRFTAENCIKPDPPVSVRANGVEGGERMLGVSWGYPASWRRGFYYLRFQIRYRPSQSEKYQTKDTQTLRWTITDALPHTEYEVQVRAREEFNNGNWSDWSQPVYACTWTPLEYTTVPLDDTQDPIWIMEGSGSGEEIKVDAAVSGESMDVATVCGVCVLALMVILLSVYVFRHRMRFASTLGKLGSSAASSGGGGSDAPAAHPQPRPQEEENPLMSPVSPTPSEVTMQHHFPSELEENGQNVHFHNMGYFLVPKE